MFNFKKEIIYPEDKKSLQRFEQYREYYKIKYDICKEIGPKTIAEIGVRAGYSAWTFLQACPSAKYFGFDANNGKHGGQGGESGVYFKWAKNILREYDYELIQLDTQKVNSLGIKNIDFFHVDGDHSVKGVQHDLDLAFDCIDINGVILIDDIIYISDVKEGFDIWKLKMGTKINYEFRESLRGEMIIRKISN